MPAVRSARSGPAGPPGLGRPGAVGVCLMAPSAAGQPGQGRWLAAPRRLPRRSAARPHPSTGDRRGDGARCRRQADGHTCCVRLAHGGQRTDGTSPPPLCVTSLHNKHLTHATPPVHPSIYPSGARQPGRPGCQRPAACRSHRSRTPSHNTGSVTHRVSQPVLRRPRNSSHNSGPATTYHLTILDRTHTSSYHSDRRRQTAADTHTLPAPAHSSGLTAADV